MKQTISTNYLFENSSVIVRHRKQQIADTFFFKMGKQSREQQLELKEKVQKLKEVSDDFNCIATVHNVNVQLGENEEGKGTSPTERQVLCHIGA